jgi:hypothetical protein
MTSQEEVLRAARLVVDRVQELRKISEDLF